jgi:hypothetical protein
MGLLRRRTIVLGGLAVAAAAVSAPRPRPGRAGDTRSISGWPRASRTPSAWCCGPGWPGTRWPPRARRHAGHRRRRRVAGVRDRVLRRAGGVRCGARPAGRRAQRARDRPRSALRRRVLLPFPGVGRNVHSGRTRTTPRTRHPRTTTGHGFVSCANWESGYYTAYKRLAEDQPDLILHLGDYIYENAPVPGVVRRHEGEVAITRRVLPDLGPQNPQRALTVTAFQIQRGAGEDRSTPHQLDPDPVHTTAMSEPQSASAPGISSALRQLQTDQTRHATDCRLWGRCRERGTAGHGRYQHRPTTTPVDVGTRLSNVALDTRSRTE